MGSPALLNWQPAVFKGPSLRGRVQQGQTYTIQVSQGTRWPYAVHTRELPNACEEFLSLEAVLGVWDLVNQPKPSPVVPPVATPPPLTRAARRAPVAGRGNHFSPAEQQELRRLYPTARWADILAAVLGRTRRQVIAWAEHQGIERETEKARQRGPRKKLALHSQPSKAERTPATPVLDARKSVNAPKAGPSRLARALDLMKSMPGAHPARLAYAAAARTGDGHAALEAFERTYKQQKGGANG